MTAAQPDALTTEDRLDIAELFARYGWCFDSGAVEEFVALFTPTAAYELDGGRRFVGHAQIRSYIAQAATSAWLPGRQHHVDQIVIEGSATRATARAYCTVTQRAPDGGMSLVYLGRYADVCVKVDDRWLFEERVVRSWSADEIKPASG